MIPATTDDCPMTGECPGYDRDRGVCLGCHTPDGNAHGDSSGGRSPLPNTPRTG